ncbi:hypothetical protein F0562_011023 [Nyssa sinensis]|uniref:Ionotropic glutamate receptor C-terminal domain-containing protein n=1 Tax=Nyssa sinensis TaxID=561372 RepID=A0A5J5A2C1_9ASTE|nr:hypothetical protein F0562_011023 [Nyssa sinensis]
MVMVAWLFLLLVITSSYTASLTSILTVQQLSSSITGIDSLIASNWPIGYQVGSFAYGYMTDSLYIPRSRLVPLGSPEEYDRALRQGPSNGGVAGIIDELPYVELFLSKQTDFDFGIIGQPFTKNRWGFAFQRDSPLAIDVSTTILKLVENGKLQQIREKWFCKTSSGIAHVISHVVNELHVPLLSFGATDPTLSALQYPYFLRTTESDYFQMYAIADLVEFYGWKEVIAIFVDDDYGRSGISVLGDALAKKRAKIAYKAAFTARAPISDINDLLVGVNLMESRVYVVHVNLDSGLTIFSVAKDFGMMTNGYVWIATDWLPAVLDSLESVDPDTMDLLEGVVALRHYTPDSNVKRSFTSRWKNLKLKETSSFNTYALYAYDSVWLVVRALDVFFNEGGNISFSKDLKLHDTNASTLYFTALRTFDEG